MERTPVRVLGKECDECPNMDPSTCPVKVVAQVVRNNARNQNFNLEEAMEIANHEGFEDIFLAQNDMVHEALAACPHRIKEPAHIDLALIQVQVFKKKNFTLQVNISDDENL